MAKTVTYKDLIVWQRAMELVVAVYALTEVFPRVEQYGMTSQMRRSSVSIPSNIAEGRRRASRRDFRQFLVIAYGSGAELETQLEICRRLSMGEIDAIERAESLLGEVMRMLNKMSYELKD